ncbi:zinc metalloprotease [[Clostridium] polysaccharolyticum]|uniref:Peptide zinc metalloprotease protein n=1 Tax=[Clostridium] polysaccharolyticum TaxID=29364 RepID=A0A1I0CBU6_9FIRM|nr:hypothetical protein [[Clostridium] polysaccharolyticum]SET17013.1 hypothetical protein SAMN04487772_109125 [[Clostridium] polysaccharolyticum]
MKKEFYLNNMFYEVIENEKGDCFIKDKRNSRYYFKRGFFASRRYQFECIEQIKWNWKDTIYTVLCMLSVFSLVFLLFHYCNIYQAEKFTGRKYFLSACYLVMSMVAHESSHAFTMYVYGRKYGKIHVKLYYHVFLAIVTDTTDSYLLPRYRRFFVCYAGVMSNLLMYGFTLLRFPASAYLLRIALWGVIYNMIPFGGMKTDGYHIMINILLRQNDVKGKKHIIGQMAQSLFFISIMLSLIYSIARCLDSVFC